MADGNREQAEFWEDRAASWIAGETHSEMVNGRFGQRAMERLEAFPGERILDIGCGSGPTAVELARRVAPEGSVLGVDIAETMIQAAKARAEAEGIGNIEFRVADAQVDDLGDAAFDAAFSRFGVMFFSDPAVAFANILRSLRPGGRLAFACWQDLVANEWMFVPGAAVVSVTGVVPPMPAPGEPGPFSLAPEGRAESLLATAGFTEIVVEPCVETLAFPENEMDAFIDMSSKLGPVHQALKDADDGERSRVLSAVRTALEDKVVDGELRLGASTWVITALRPG
jgi:SAM-dependent methyltransferase